MINKDFEEQSSPKVRQVMDLLVTGTILSSLFLFPGATMGIAAIYKAYKGIQREKDFSKWQKFNQSRLKVLLKRLRRQKLIRVTDENGFGIVRLTEKGKRKVLKYKLGEIKISKPVRWDGKWRLVIYDITKFKRQQQGAFRKMLKQLDFLPLQKSVYLSPYPCEKEIEFLREYFEVGEGVIYIIAHKIENEEIYRKHFGL